MFSRKATVTSQHTSFSTVFAKSKKGIGPVVAGVMLLVITVIAGVGFQTWYQSFQGDKLVDVRDSSETGLGDRIDAVKTDTIYAHPQIMQQFHPRMDWSCLAV